MRRAPAVDMAAVAAEIVAGSSCRGRHSTPTVMEAGLGSRFKMKLCGCRVRASRRDAASSVAPVALLRGLAVFVSHSSIAP